MFRRPALTVSLLAGSLSACYSLPAETERPALIANPTPESSAEIRTVLEQALGRREIRIAADALTESSILALEPGADPGGPARGRLVEMPERFELVLSGGRCYLVRSGTRQRFVLEHAECVPAEP